MSGLAGPFIVKLVDEFRAGHVTAAIALVSNRATETSWFKPLFNGLLCFVDHRIHFDNTIREQATTGSIFAYFGPNPALFDERFRQFGEIMTRFK